jgi:hypothetical protein
MKSPPLKFTIIRSSSHNPTTTTTLTALIFSIHLHVVPEEKNNLGETVLFIISSEIWCFCFLDFLDFFWREGKDNVGFLFPKRGRSLKLWVLNIVLGR